MNIIMDMDSKRDYRVLQKHYTIENNILTLIIDVGEYELEGKTISASFTPSAVEVGPLSVVEGLIHLQITAGMIGKGVNNIQFTFRWGDFIEQSGKLVWVIDESLVGTTPSDDTVDIISTLIALTTTAISDLEGVNTTVSDAEVIRIAQYNLVEQKLADGEFVGIQGETGEVTTLQLNDLAGVGRTTETVKANADNIATKANKVQEPWITPTLVNGWIPFNEYLSTAQYHKDSLGYVRLRGIIKSGTSGVVFTLPVGYRPLYTLYSPTVSNGFFAYLRIANSGTINFTSYSNLWVSLENVSFKAEG